MWHSRSPTLLNSTSLFWPLCVCFGGRPLPLFCCCTVTSVLVDNKDDNDDNYGSALLWPEKGHACLHLPKPLRDGTCCIVWEACSRRGWGKGSSERVEKKKIPESVAIEVLDLKKFHFAQAGFAQTFNVIVPVGLHTNTVARDTLPGWFMWFMEYNVKFNKCKLSLGY